MALRTQDSIQIEQLKRNKDAQELTAMAQMTDEQRNKYLKQRQVVKSLQKYNAQMVGLLFLCVVLAIPSIGFPPLFIILGLLVWAIIKIFKKYKLVKIEYNKIFEVKK